MHPSRAKFLQRACALLVCTLISVTAPAENKVGTKVEPGGLEFDRTNKIDLVPGDLSDSAEETAEENRQSGRKSAEFLIAPLPSRDPLLGWTLTLPVMFLYKPGFTTEEDSTWVTGAVGFVAEDDNWGAGAFHRMSLGGDQWRLMGGYFFADLRYDFFGIGGDPNTSVPLKQPIGVVLAEALRQTWPDLFFGLRVTYADTDASLNTSASNPPPDSIPPDLNVEYELVTLVPRMLYDTRDHEFYPTDGYYVEGQVALGREWLGSDTEYERWEVAANNYRPIGRSGVLGLRGVLQYVSGDAPFFLFPAFGAEVDLRGYQTGSFRDRFLFATQAEYRHRFTNRFGAVAFAGIGTVDDDVFSWDETLPSIGGGLRWVLATKNNVSLRFDYAWGKDDQQFYVGIGEAF